MSIEKQTGFPERYRLGLPEPVKALGRGVVWFFSLHQLSSHGNHFDHDSLASPLEPIQPWGLESDGVDLSSPRTWEDYAQSGHAIIEHANGEVASGSDE